MYNLLRCIVSFDVVLEALQANSHLLALLTAMADTRDVGKLKR